MEFYCISQSSERYLYITASQYHLASNSWHYILLEDGKHVPKHVGETHVIFIPITNVFLVGITKVDFNKK